MCSLLASHQAQLPARRGGGAYPPLPAGGAGGAMLPGRRRLRRRRTATPSPRGHWGLGPPAQRVVPVVRHPPRRGGWATHPSQRGGWPPPVSTSASCPARQAGTWRQGASRSSASCQPRGARVMPLQLREMRLSVKGQEVVKLVSSLPLPLFTSPSPPTPPTKPGGALYGLDFTWDAVWGSGFTDRVEGRVTRREGERAASCSLTTYWSESSSSS